MENFVVSARKYRPSTFASVVGQSHITQTLKNAIEREQLAHAYLFTGPRGVGKTTCARIFARAINCFNPTPDHEACGVCESCESFRRDRSFNIHELDAASNNSVDDIRALTEKVRIAPQIGRYSIYIIDEVHMLSTAAFNAFLKTLEEPPHYAIFILATTERHKILPTILSRCQAYDFNRIRVEDIVGYLQFIAARESITFDEESLHIIAQKADGGMRDALSIFDRVVSFCGNNLVFNQVAESIGTLDLNTYFNIVDRAMVGDFPALLMIYDEIQRRGIDGQQFITGLGEHFRNLLIAHNPDTISLLEVTPGISTRYIEQSKACDIEFLFNAINLLSITDNGYRTATNRRLHIELNLVKLSALKKKEHSIATIYPMPQIVAPADGTPISSSASLTQPPVSSQTPPTSSDSVSSNSVSQTPSSVPSTALPTPASLVPQTSPSPSSFVPSNASSASPSVPSPISASQSPKPSPFQLTGINISAVKSPESHDISTAQVSIAPIIAELHTTESLTAAMPQILNHLSRRPRIIAAMSDHRIDGHTIYIYVADSIILDELNQSKHDLEQQISILTSRRVEFVATLVERSDSGPSRPVTLEQKLQYLTNLNPHLLKLSKSLDLTI